MTLSSSLGSAIDTRMRTSMDGKAEASIKKVVSHYEGDVMKRDVMKQGAGIFFN